MWDKYKDIPGLPKPYHAAPRGLTLIEKLDYFTEKPDGEDGCWLYTGTITKGRGTAGYGHISIPGVPGKKMLAHRASYEARVGPIPDGMSLDHECHNRDLSCLGGDTCLHRRCINPAHLTPETRAQNRRKAGLARDRKPWLDTDLCPKGHQFIPDNTVVYTKKNGYSQRFCRTCQRENSYLQGMGKPRPQTAPGEKLNRWRGGNRPRQEDTV
jgi:hypothetical protein